MLDDALTIARSVGVDRFTIYALARRGAIPVYRIGRRVRFDLTEVKAAMREQPRWTMPRKAVNE